MSTSSGTDPESPKQSASSSSSSDSSSSGDSIRDGPTNLGAAEVREESCRLKPSKVKPQQPSDTSSTTFGSFMHIPHYKQSVHGDTVIIRSYTYKGGETVPGDTILGTSLVHGSFMLQSLRPDPTHSVTGFTMVTSKRDEEHAQIEQHAPAPHTRTPEQEEYSAPASAEPSGSASKNIDNGDGDNADRDNGVRDNGVRDNGDCDNGDHDNGEGDEPDELQLSSTVLFDEHDIPPETQEEVHQNDADIGGNFPKSLPPGGLHDIVHFSTSTEELLEPAILAQPPSSTRENDCVPERSPQTNHATSNEHHSKIVAFHIRDIDRKKTVDSVFDHNSNDKTVLQTITVSGGPELHPTVYPYGLDDSSPRAHVQAVTLRIRVHNPSNLNSEKDYRLTITVKNDDETEAVSPLPPLCFKNSPQQLKKVELIPYLKLLESRSAKLHIAFKVESMNHTEPFMRSLPSSAIPINKKT